jgi:membrane protein DedA with SNARE-associated domain
MFDWASYWDDVPLGLILFALAMSELGLPLPEPVLVVAVGVASQRGGLALHVPVWSSCVAVLLGDLLLVCLARTVGAGVLERRPLRWLVPPSVQPRIDALFERHGSMAIFVARFITGIRLAVFVLAGMRKMSLLRFIFWDGLAILLSVPIFAALGFSFATRAQALKRHLTQANFLTFAVLVLVVAGYVAVVVFRRRGKRTARAGGLGNSGD